MRILGNRSLNGTRYISTFSTSLARLTATRYVPRHERGTASHGAISTYEPSRKRSISTRLTLDCANFRCFLRKADRPAASILLARPRISIVVMIRFPERKSMICNDRSVGGSAWRGTRTGSATASDDVGAGATARDDGFSTIRTSGK